ncbi:16640_t:CDS:2, partial [Dentiscutata heterogama]
LFTDLFLHYTFGNRYYNLKSNIGLFIEECWHDDPGKRPVIDEVTRELRKTCEKKLEQFKAFYSTFCPPNKVLDSTLQAKEIEKKLTTLSQPRLQLKILPS